MSSDWRTVTLADAPLTIMDGDRGTNYPSQDDFSPTGHCLFLNTGNVTTEGFNFSSCAFITSEKDSALRKGKLIRGDVVLTTRGTVGNVGYFNNAAPFEHVRINSGMVILRPKQEEISSHFLYLFVRSSLFKKQVKALQSGSAQPQLPIRDMKRIEIPIPPLHEQSAICSMLGSLDDRITLLRETNATLEAMAQTLFKSWFVDFDPVHAKQQGRAPEGMDAATAALFPDSFEESACGIVPKGWRVSAIGDFVPVVDYVANGSFASLKENVTLSTTEDYALYLRTTDFNSKFSGDFRYVDKKSYDFLSKSSLDGSEIIISNVGDVGTVFRPPTWLNIPMTLGSNAIALKKRELSSYLYLHFNSSKGQHDIASIVTGSAQMKFNKTNFRALQIIFPEIKVLNYFEGAVEILFSKINCNLASIQALSVLRDTLLPRLISGQLRLPEAEELLAEAI